VVNATPRPLYFRGRDLLHTVEHLKVACSSVTSAMRSGIQKAVFIKITPNSVDTDTKLLRSEIMDMTKVSVCVSFIKCAHSTKSSITGYIQLRHAA
jgi:hypothetical protein